MAKRVEVVDATIEAVDCSRDDVQLERVERARRGDRAAASRPRCVGGGEHRRELPDANRSKRLGARRPSSGESVTERSAQPGGRRKRGSRACARASCSSGQRSRSGRNHSSARAGRRGARARCSGTAWSPRAGPPRDRRGPPRSHRGRAMRTAMSEGRSSRERMGVGVDVVLAHRAAPQPGCGSCLVETAAAEEPRLVRDIEPAEPRSDDASHR